jgi:hypothetical protein
MNTNQVRSNDAERNADVARGWKFFALSDITVPA